MAALAALLGGSALASCAPLDDLVETGCGDRILSIGEDCDGAPRVEGDATFECIPRGEEGACHFRAVQSACPIGLRAGLDGVCLRPAGAFDVATPIPVVATRAATARFAGDGRAQLVLATEAGDVPFYFDGRTPVDPGFAFGRYLQRSAAIGDLTGDGRDDALVAIGDRLLTFQGSKFDLRTYASDDPGGRFRVVPVDAPAAEWPGTGASPHADLDAFARLFECGATGPVASICAEAGTGAVLYAALHDFPMLLPNGAIARPYADIGPITRVRLAASRPCRDLALLSVSKPELDVLPVCSVCDDAEPPNCAPDAAFTVPLVDTSQPGCTSILPKAAFAVPAGPVDLLLVEGECVGDGRRALYGIAGTASAFVGFLPGHGFADQESASAIQGIADLNQDGFYDVVTTSQVFLTQGDQLGDDDFPVFTATAGWSRALVVDVNRDGWLDVVGARLDVGLDVLLGGPFSAFAPGFVTTAARVDAFTVDDFDGDGTGDVFLAEGGAPCGANARLSVAFGRALGFPEPPTSIGETPWTAEIVSGRALDAAALNPDSIADAVLVSTCESESLHAAALFNGSSSRILSSPYFLRTPEVDDKESASVFASSLATADLVHPGGWGADQLPDLIAFGPGGESYRPTLLVVPGSSGANLVATSGLDASNVLQIMADSPIESGLSVATGDVMGDDVPEILAGSAFYEVDPETDVVRTVAGLFVVSAADLAGATTIGSRPPFATTSAEFFSPETRVAALDVDGNGELDAVFLATESDEGVFGEPEPGSSVGVGSGGGPTPDGGEASELIVAFRTGGVLGAPCKIASDKAVLTDFTSLDVGDAARAFVVSSTLGTLRFDAAGGDPCAGTFVPFPATGRELTAFESLVRGIAASDFDGDGLEDLALLGDAGTTVLYQTARAFGDE